MARQTRSARRIGADARRRAPFGDGRPSPDHPGICSYWRRGGPVGLVSAGLVAGTATTAPRDDFANLCVYRAVFCDLVLVLFVSLPVELCVCAVVCRPDRPNPGSLLESGSGGETVPDGAGNDRGAGCGAARMDGNAECLGICRDRGPT